MGMGSSRRIARHAQQSELRHPHYHPRANALTAWVACDDVAAALRFASLVKAGHDALDAVVVEGADEQRSPVAQLRDRNVRLDTQDLGAVLRRLHCRLGNGRHDRSRSQQAGQEPLAGFAGRLCKQERNAQSDRRARRNVASGSHAENRHLPAQRAHRAANRVLPTSMEPPKAPSRG